MALGINCQETAVINSPMFLLYVLPILFHELWTMLIPKYGNQNATDYNMLHRTKLTFTKTRSKHYTARRTVAHTSCSRAASRCLQWRELPYGERRHVCSQRRPGRDWGEQARLWAPQSSSNGWMCSRTSTASNGTVRQEHWLMWTWTTFKGIASGDYGPVHHLIELCL